MDIQIDKWTFTISYGDGLIINPDTDTEDGEKFLQAVKLSLTLMPKFESVIRLRDYYAMGGKGFKGAAIDDIESAKQLYELIQQGIICVDIEHFNALTSAIEYSKTIRPTSKPKAVKPGYVYLIQSPTGAYKIGRTSNPDNRMRTFSVKLPFEVEYIAVIPAGNMYALESDLHIRYADKRVNGEWFNLTPADVDYIKSLAVQS